MAGLGLGAAQSRTNKNVAHVHTKVVERYRGKTVISSYQLENEALLASFGRRPKVDRARLQAEFALVKKLDPSRPVIMSTSTSWGIPLRRPIPDSVAFSFYRILYSNGQYRHALHFPILDKLRALLCKLIIRRNCFIHELQLEPWGPTAIWKMPVSEQDKSMSPVHIRKNVALASKTNLYPIDLWGGEWWYWRLRRKSDPTIWEAVQSSLLASSRP